MLFTDYVFLITKKTTDYSMDVFRDGPINKTRRCVFPPNEITAASDSDEDCYVATTAASQSVVSKKC